MWSQIINTTIGIWLMAAPAILSYNEAGSNSSHIVGPLSPLLRSFLFGKRPMVYASLTMPACWLLLAPWVLGYTNSFSIINDMACGVLVLILASVGMKIKGSYGGGWKMLWQ